MRLTVLAALVVVAGAVAVSAGRRTEGEVLTTDGVRPGPLREVVGGEKGVVKYGGSKGGTGRNEVALSKVVRLHFAHESKRPKTGFFLVMTNGDRIACDIVGGDENGPVVRSETLGKRKISIDNLLAVFHLVSAHRDAFIEDKAALENTSDIVFLKGGQETQGVLKRVTDKGVVIKDEKLGSISLQWENVRGVKLVPLSDPKQIKGIKASAYLTDGGRLSGKLTSYKKEKLLLKWFGHPVELGKDILSSVYFSNGRFSYLSDLKLSKVVETPFFDTFLYHYQLDHSLVRKRTISLRGKKFFKGVSVHSKTELTYELDGKYKKLLSTIGIDDEAKGKGDVVFAVYGDGKKLFDSGSITGKSRPRPIEVGLKGVKELKLVVDFGRDLDTMDRAVWADAVLVK